MPSIEKKCQSGASSGSCEARERVPAGGRGGEGGGESGWSGLMEEKSRRRCARWEGKRSGRIARRRERGEGDSRSRTQRGASGARRGCGGLRAERHTRERRERKHAPPVERPCGRMADVACAGPKGSPTRRAPWELRSQRWRPGRAQRGRWVAPAAAPGGTPPARYCGAEPHRRAETGKAGLATWTAAGKRRMSVVRHASRTAPNPSGHDARRRGLWRMVRVGSRDAARRDADTRNGAGGGGRLEAGEQAA